MTNHLKSHLLEALAEVADNHSIASTQGLVNVLRRHLAGDGDPELDHALIRAQFMIASRRYLRAAPMILRAHESNRPLQAARIARPKESNIDSPGRAF